MNKSKNRLILTKFIAIGVPLLPGLVDERQAENIPFEPDAGNADAGKK